MQTTIEACMTLDEHTYSVGIWYLDIPRNLTKFGRGGNIMVQLARPKTEPDNWTVAFRIRHYRDERIHFSEDDFQVSTVRIHCLESEAVASCNEVMDDCARPFNGAPYFYAIGGDAHTFMRLAEVNPPYFLHMRKL